MRSFYNTTSAEIARITGGRLLSGTGSEEIRCISSDSRDLGEGCLFVPIKGDKFDGHDFISDLCREGKITAYITSSEDVCDDAGKSGIAAVKVNDTLAAIGNIALYHREAMDPRVIGVTGTNGKTTTKELIARVLSSRYTVLKSEKNYNNEIGVPFTLMGLDKNHTHAVIEMGMNHTGEISRLTRMVKPDVAVITSIGEGHLEYLGSVENVARAKAEIMESMQPGSPVVVNSDSPCLGILEGMASERKLRVITCGLTGKADLHPELYHLTPDGLELVVNGTPFSIPLYGIHNLYNVLAALAVADIEGISPAECSAALKDFESVGGRGQIVDRGYLVINDTYNSNPLSSRYALSSVREIFPDRRRIAVLSDMKELGEAAPACHYDTGRFAAENGFDMLLLWGEMAGEYREGAKKGGLNGERVRIFDSKENLSDYLKKNLSDNDVVLVKGSRSTRMEDVVNSILDNKR